MTEIALREKAKAYLQLCYRELNKEDLFEERWLKVLSSIEEKGTYELLDFELIMEQRLPGAIRINVLEGCFGVPWKFWINVLYIR